MTRKDIDDIIKTICPNDEDFEKPIISPKYLKQELEQLAVEQEPCEDAISRNAIIQTLNNMDRYIANELILCDTNKKFPQNEVFIVDDVYEEIVEQLPFVTSKAMWIPVSERLPEEDTECLVTVLHNEPYSFKYEYKVTEAYYAEYWGLFDDDYSGVRILAWMPLPEPYKESEE